MARTTETLVSSEGLEVAPFGILSGATTVIEDDSIRWLDNYHYEIADAGVKVQNEPITGGGNAEATVVDNSEETETFKVYYPFSIKVELTSSTFGTIPEEIEDRAREALEAVTQKAVEYEFWNGDIAKTLTVEHDNRWLSSDDALDITPSGGPVKVRYGQALLEEALGEDSLGTVGTIHAPRLIASVLDASDKDGTLTTNLGNKIVAGTGYSKFGPKGQVAPEGQAWMFATGPVTVKLGQPTIVPVKMSQAVNSLNNKITYYVDRPAGVTWSTTNLHAVLVDLSLDYT